MVNDGSEENQSASCFHSLFLAEPFPSTAPGIQDQRAGQAPLVGTPAPPKTTTRPHESRSLRHSSSSYMCRSLWCNKQAFGGVFIKSSRLIWVFGNS